ncbi:hypothetical protein [Neobacillus dielmonensis]|uniref:hypothetical protein n=1 Tax=Neobacillus dielmonensis TaxID=1347369 RepID=UPI0012B626CA|nr:hypothetical protein [Neobacillus dielmonensis]
MKHRDGSCASTQKLSYYRFGGVTSAWMTTSGKGQNAVDKSVDLHPSRRSNLLDSFPNFIVLVIPFFSVFVFLGALL